MTAYGYARVSTRGQARDGNGLDVQERQLADAGCDEIVREVYTGATTGRPALESLLVRLSPGDRIVATKLDRIARSTVEGCELVRSLIDRGVAVQVLNMGTLEDTPVGRCMVSVMFAMAEFERDMIAQRTREGRALAREREGYREGRPRKEVDMSDVRRHMALVASREETVAEACAALGVGRTKWYELRGAAA